MNGNVYTKMCITFFHGSLQNNIYINISYLSAGRQDPGLQCLFCARHFYVP